MIRKFYYILLFFCLSACPPPLKYVEVPLHIIPEPVEILQTDACLSVHKQKLVFEVDESLKPKLSEWKTQFGIKTNESKESTKIYCSINENLRKESKYKLIINQKGIQITASDFEGLYYALQTMKQIFDTDDSNLLCIPHCEINDYPRFKYRGMHLDVCRHYFNVDFIKKYIDLLAYHKFNYFHWHLTEDQGWRIEIKKYPKLQEIAAFRKETLIGHYNDQPHKFDNTKYGAYYSHSEIKEIVKYAEERMITVVPEIEMPGHAQAALAAYPQLGCTGGPYEVLTKWGISENVYCPYEKTFDFLEGVIDEVVELFPGPYIHIGGDECPKTTWKNSAFCQQLIKDKALKDEHGLQSYFIKRMQAYINEKGKKIIGWDEILEGGIAPNATVMSWRGTEGGIQAAKQGHEVIMTPTSHCYFDYYQSEDENEPLAIGGFLPLERVYNYEPIPAELDSEFHKYVLGAQGNVWTEYMNTSNQVEYMAYPRACAISETNWSPVAKKNYKYFTKKLQSHYNRLSKKRVNFADHLSEVTAVIKNKQGKLIGHLKTPNEKVDIKYWSNKNTEKKLYKESFELPKMDTLFYASFDGEQRASKIYKNVFTQHKGIKCDYKLLVEASEKYGVHGSDLLMNGILANPNKFGDKEWLGFNGTGTSVMIDFEKLQDISKIKLGFFNAPAYWIYLPRKVIIYISEDGQTWSKIFESKKIEGQIKRLEYPISLNEIKTKFLKVSIENFGRIPQGAEGAGHKAWLFLDEIQIY